MVRYLLDTNVVSEPVKAAPDEGVMQKLQEHEAEIATGAPVWHELCFGCARLPASRKRRMLEAFLDTVVRPRIPIVPYDESAAAVHARERARLAALGKMPSFVDGQIAAIACVSSLVLVTRNASDFREFRDLVVECWHTGISR